MDDSHTILAGDGEASTGRVPIHSFSKGALAQGRHISKSESEQYLSFLLMLSICSQESRDHQKMKKMAADRYFKLVVTDGASE
ncbi:hypothetical protein M0R45_015305 [Rubus argutus]|uniref:Uncharacterized protein n=1 Tax=Rubus argutus TaxID=59490 RepID=A0AAW1XQF2_RUBAR